MIMDIIFIFFMFSTGVVIAGAVFAFIIIIGVIPTIITKTRTKSHIKFYENVIVMSGILGTIIEFTNIRLSLPKIFVVSFGFSAGIFVGCLAISLAETLDVLPVIFRRFKMNIGLSYVVLALGLGKMVGSILTVTKSLFYNM